MGAGATVVCAFAQIPAKKIKGKNIIPLVELCIIGDFLEFVVTQI
jgi:hypothetical protein